MFFGRGSLGNLESFLVILDFKLRFAPEGPQRLHTFGQVVAYYTPFPVNREGAILSPVRNRPSGYLQPLGQLRPRTPHWPRSSSAVSPIVTGSCPARFGPLNFGFFIFIPYFEIMMLRAPAESVSSYSCANHGQPPSQMAQPRHSNRAALSKFHIRAAFGFDVLVIP